MITTASQANVLSSFGDAGPESRKLATLYQQIARDAGCGFFDAGVVAGTSPADGAHLDAANTRAIGLAVAPSVMAMLHLSASGERS